MLEILPPQMDAPLSAVATEDAQAFFRRAFEAEQAHDFAIRQAEAHAQPLGRVDWKRCRFSSCRLPGADFRDGDFSNVLFESCDLSGANFNGAIFGRAVFRGCKMTGADLAACGLNDVLFEDCALDYISLTATRANGLLFRECRMREALLGEMAGKRYAFESCDLTRAALTQTSLKGLNLTGSVIDGIIAGERELRGATVSAAQACELARLLGVIVK